MERTPADRGSAKERERPRHPGLDRDLDGHIQAIAPGAALEERKRVAALLPSPRRGLRRPIGRAVQLAFRAARIPRDDPEATSLRGDVPRLASRRVQLRATHGPT